MHGTSLKSLYVLFLRRLSWDRAKASASAVVAGVRHLGGRSLCGLPDWQSVKGRLVTERIRDHCWRIGGVLLE